jgi:hypothetical protein
VQKRGGGGYSSRGYGVEWGRGVERGGDVVGGEGFVQLCGASAFRRGQYCTYMPLGYSLCLSPSPQLT